MDDIIIYYMKNLTPYSLVLKHISFMFWFFIISGIINMITIFYFIINNLPIIYDLPFVLFFIFMLIILNCHAKKKLCNKYGILTEGIFWMGSNFEKMQKDKLKVYLYEKQLLNDTKIKMLIELIGKEAERVKFNGFIEKGVLLAILIPVWSEFVKWSFNHANGIQDILKVVFIIILFVFLYYIAKSMALDILDRERNSLKNIVKLLERIQIEL